MNRFEQRLHASLEDEEVAAGYREMEAFINLVRGLDAAREQLHIDKETLAAGAGIRRETLSRLLNAPDDANPTLATITGLVSALGLTADITLRRAEHGDAPLTVALAL